MFIVVVVEVFINGEESSPLTACHFEFFWRMLPFLSTLARNMAAVVPTSKAPTRSQISICICTIKHHVQFLFLPLPQKLVCQTELVKA
jgi:hypothetical protein